LQKATVSFFMSLRSSLYPHEKTQLTMDGFHENRYLSILQKFVNKVEVSLKYDKNKGHFTWRRQYIYDNTRTSFISS